MRSLPHRQAWALAVLAAGLSLLAGCSSPPKSATSAPPGISTDGVAIAHVDQRDIDDLEFRRISEYFTGQENTSGRIIERTDPQQRAGHYFILSLEFHPRTTLPKGTQADLDYIRKNHAETVHQHFVFSADTGTWNEILLGLTGAAWPEKDESIVAWKITLKDATGKLLADRQSFMWGIPDPAPVAASATMPAKVNP